MNPNRTGSRKGFSLVELLAVVMILAVLAAIAIPMYINRRKTAAARTCISNITAIAAAEAAWAARNGSYLDDVSVPSGSVTQGQYIAGTATTAPTGGLVGAPEGLSQILKCPLALPTTLFVTNQYRVASSNGNCIIFCTNSAEHAKVLGINPDTYTKTLAAPIKEGALP